MKRFALFSAALLSFVLSGCTCFTCGGSGWEPGSTPGKPRGCPDCRMTGKNILGRPWFRCPECYGVGMVQVTSGEEPNRQGLVPCMTCRGH